MALARRESPHQGGRLLGLAEALVGELPHTMAALDAGQINEWRATLIARETACLSIEHRRQVDEQLAALPGGMGALGGRAIAAEARRIGCRLEPYSVTHRASKAAAGRRVSLRPAPDTMTWLGALLPAAQGVAAYAALTRAADCARAGGEEPRCRGQVMADTLVERLTGQATAEAVPVEVQLIITDKALLGGDNEPAETPGVGPVPAPLTRRWLRGNTTETDTPAAVIPAAANSAAVDPAAAGTSAKAWIRRLYTSPDTGQLVAMDSRRRCFDGQLRRFVIAVDRTCRTPWCDAPIRHLDHAVRAADGGETTLDNATGRCEACNYTKEALGWTTTRFPDRALAVETPTGHLYTSRPPPPVGHTTQRPPPPCGDTTRRPPPCGDTTQRAAPPRGHSMAGASASVLEQRLRDLLAS